MTIKNRLTFRFTLIVGTLLLLFSLSIYFLSLKFLREDFANKFKEKASLTSALILKDGLVNEDLVSEINKNLLNSILKEKIVIMDEAGNVQYSSYPEKSFPFNKLFIEKIHRNKEVFSENSDIALYGILVKGIDKNLVVVAEARKEYMGELNQLKLFLITAWFFSLGLIFLTGRYFAGKALRPISIVVNEVDTISATNLHNRVSEGNEKDEIAHLATTFNRLLERLEESFLLQRNFVSNAAHELRTPLSSITAQLEVTLLNKRSSEEYQLVLNSVLEDIRDLNRLSEGLFDLTLASRDVSLMKFNNIRIDDLLLQAKTELLKRKIDYKIHIHFGEFPDDENQLTLFGKEHLLKSVFINLMDNACKFSANKTVDVYLQVEPGLLKVDFKDNGIGMPDSYIKNIFKPLLRGENAKRIPGHGLGLALAKKIIELHRGNIQVVSEENKGTTVALSLSSL